MTCSTVLSTASLVLGVAASGASGTAIGIAGIAGLLAGALSMAAPVRTLVVESQEDLEIARASERRSPRLPPGPPAALRSRRALRAG